MAMYTEAEKRGKIGREPSDTADYYRFMLRMPQEMAWKIDALAKVDLCPMNAYILRMLKDNLKARPQEVEDALREVGTPPPPAVAAKSGAKRKVS